MKRDECVVQYIKTCSQECDTKPFETSNPVLRTLQSGFAASDEIVIDLKKAISKQDEQILSVQNELFYSKKPPIRDTILKTKGSTC